MDRMACAYLLTPGQDHPSGANKHCIYKHLSKGGRLAGRQTDRQTGGPHLPLASQLLLESTPGRPAARPALSDGLDDDAKSSRLN